MTVKKSSIWLIVIILLVVLVGAGGAWLYIQSKKAQEVPPIEKEAMVEREVSGEATQEGVVTEKASPPNSQPVSQPNQQEVDQIIKTSVLSMAAPTITDVVITKKQFFTDSQNNQWVRFHVNPVPEGATDPAYGVMKKAVGGEWEMVNFGTCCIEDDLPSEVRQGLGF